jgi:excisionase family DNA binding protein
MNTDITVKEAAALLRVSEDTVRSSAKTGKWPHMRPTPRRVTFTDQQIEQIRNLNTFVPSHTDHERNSEIRSNLRLISGDAA